MDSKALTSFSRSQRMWSFLADLIYLIASVWMKDTEIRDQSPFITGSEFDRDGRRFVARVCTILILLVLITGVAFWWLAKK